MHGGETGYSFHGENVVVNSAVAGDAEVQGRLLGGRVSGSNADETGVANPNPNPNGEASIREAGKDSEADM